MSRNLFIRVSAVTYDEKDVPKTWPHLSKAVWPDEGVSVTGGTPRGVLELAREVVEAARFNTLPDGAAQAFAPMSARLEELLDAMDDALGDQNVAQAKTLAGKIESALDEAENVLS